MRCHVALTPAEAAAAPLGIVVDVMRATSTIAQALAAGYRRVLCAAEVADALALKAELGEEAITGGERDAQRVEGFDAGASPREFREPRAETLILSTTNGTRSIVAAAAACEQVVLGALLNLAAVVRIARVPFVVERISVSARGSRNSRGEAPTSKPSITTASRSPPTTESGSEARSARASSISAQQRTRRYPEASACAIVEVARTTSTTMPTGAAADSAGVKAT